MIYSLMDVKNATVQQTYHVMRKLENVFAPRASSVNNVTPVKILAPFRRIFLEKLVVKHVTNV